MNIIPGPSPSNAPTAPRRLAGQPEGGALGNAGLIKQQERDVASPVAIVADLTQLRDESVTGIHLQYRLSPLWRATGRGQHLFQLQIRGVLGRNDADRTASW